MPNDSDVRLSHLLDDTERTRTHAVRTISNTLPLLTDALHALTHGSPDVTAEFIERVRDALTAELALLRTPPAVD